MEILIGEIVDWIDECGAMAAQSAWDQAIQDVRAAFNAHTMRLRAPKSSRRRKKLRQETIEPSVVKPVDDVAITSDAKPIITSASAEDLEQMLASGMSLRKIGKHFHCDHKTVSRRMKKLNMETKK